MTFLCLIVIIFSRCRKLQIQWVNCLDPIKIKVTWDFIPYAGRKLTEDEVSSSVDETLLPPKRQKRVWRPSCTSVTWHDIHHLIAQAKYYHMSLFSEFTHNVVFYSTAMPIYQFLCIQFSPVGTFCHLGQLMQMS